MLKTDVVIVTARGRHEWMCEELTRMGLNAVVLDVGDALGAWAPEDWEGPFGVFKSERISETQMAVLERNAELKNVNEGFVLWPKTGPLELKGPLSSYQFKKSGMDPVAKDYIGASENTYYQMELEKERSHLLNQDYKKIWLAHLAHTFASPIDKNFPESVKSGHGLPLFAPYVLRKPDKHSHVESKKQLEALGHFYHPVKSIKSFLSAGKKLEAIECETRDTESASLKTRKFEANYFIWLLSRQETEFLAQQWSKELFSEPTAEPLWTWTRYRFNFKACRLLDTAPEAFFIIHDMYLSWTHENFMGMVRASKNAWDVWVKIAFHRRQDKSYLQSLSLLIESRLKDRISDLQISHVEYPQNFVHDGLAPSPFVVYDEKSFTNLKQTRHSNFLFGGVESQGQMDWTGFFERQNQILRDVITDVMREREKSESKLASHNEELR